MERVYVIGHRSPDTDSICAAIAYARLKSRLTGGAYSPARAGEINPETRFVLDKFGVKEPGLLQSAKGKKLILVDHNEATQIVEGWEKAEIVEVLDHHKINFRHDKPIPFHTLPMGSSCSIIASKFISDGIELDRPMAGIMLSAILSDTVVFKSPTTTEFDRDIAKKLAPVAGVKDVEAFGIEVKKAKASIKGMSASDVIRADFKDFDFNGKKVGIGQIEVVGLDEVSRRKSELLRELESMKNSGYELVLLAATDIIDEGSELLFSGDPLKVEKAFGKKPSGGSVYIKGLMSRKKQITPALEKVF